MQEVGRLSIAAGQLKVTTEHLFHGGMYSRTVRLSAGTVITGVLIKVPTVLVVHGLARFFTENGELWLDGYGVLAGFAGRKTVLVAHSDVQMTMVFPTSAKTVEEAEREFTDEYDSLISHASATDLVEVTGG